MKPSFRSLQNNFNVPLFMWNKACCKYFETGLINVLYLFVHVRRYISPSNRYWRNTTEHYDGRDRDYGGGRYISREGRMRFRYPAREFIELTNPACIYACYLCSLAPLAFPPYPYPPPIPFYEGAPFPATGMYLNPYGGGPLYYPHPILPVDDNKLQGYVKKQM